MRPAPLRDDRRQLRRRDRRCADVDERRESAAARPCGRRRGTTRSSAGTAAGRRRRPCVSAMPPVHGQVVRVHVEQAGLRIERGAAPLRAAVEAGKDDRLLAGTRTARTGRRCGTCANCSTRPLVRLRRAGGQHVLASAAAARTAPACVGQRLRLGRDFAGHVLAGNLRYSIGNSGLPFARSNSEDEALLGGLRDGVDRAGRRAVTRHERRRRRKVAIPDVVLDAPGSARCACRCRRRAPAASWRRDCRRGDSRRRSRPPPSRSARRRSRAPRRPPCPAQLLAPPVYGPRVLRPGLVARLARMRNGVERPAQLAGADVVGADVARRRRQPFALAAADDEAGPCRRRPAW